MSIEIWPTELYLHLAATESDRTKQLDREHMTAINEAMNVGLSPIELDKFNDLAMTARDDLETHYVPAYRTSGGSGRNWRLDQAFRPGPPEGASTLTLEFECTQSLENYSVSIA